MPIPKVPPASSTPFTLGVVLNAPDPAAVPIDSPTRPGSPRTWMLPLRNVPPSTEQPSGGPLDRSGSGVVCARPQKKILKTSEFAPESELSST